MNELQPADITIPNAGMADALALNGLLNLVNNPEVTGAQVPPGENVRAVIQPREVRPAAPAQPAAIIGAPIDYSKIFFTGRIATGKDWIADQINAEIFGFADPIYYLASHFFGVTVDRNQNKDLPGMRSWLQTIGQWGRNHVDAETPYTPARSLFITMIRSLAAAGVLSNKFSVDWERFGADEMLWTNAIVRRADAFRAENPDKRITTTNVRFEHEFKALKEGQWTHFHVMCSPQTWAKRLATKKLSPQSKEVNNVSERLAMALDANVAKQLKQQGHQLKVLWNDPEVRPPSPRIRTVQQFLQDIAIAEIPEPTLDESVVIE
jgi:hypothetical protein